MSVFLDIADMHTHPKNVSLSKIALIPIIVPDLLLSTNFQKSKI
jgi:hypothetical protein